MPLNPNTPLPRTPLVNSRGVLTQPGLYYLLQIISAAEGLDAVEADITVLEAETDALNTRLTAAEADIVTLQADVAIVEAARVRSGRATVPFASFLPEDTITVTGQTGILASSSIRAEIYADNDDVYAQDWLPPIVRNVVAGVGFDLVLRPLRGLFAGPVKVNWSWSV